MLHTNVEYENIIVNNRRMLFKRIELEQENMNEFILVKKKKKCEHFFC